MIFHAWLNELVKFSSENQVSDSDDMDTQTTSSHPESGDVPVCNDEAATVGSAEGENCVI